jgi:hypothetical protein
MLLCASGLLNPKPDERLGRNGAAEVRALVTKVLYCGRRCLWLTRSHQVMQHPWFHDIDWELLEAKTTSLDVPYNSQADYNAARIRTPPPNESLSSAESIDPEENAKYFADF